MRTQALASRTKRRPAGGRAHERQADHVAARFLRGEKGLARLITPAPAAGFTLPASPGIPLATGLRAELEQAFGTDLGAVRLHTDAFAARAADSVEANAFTSGSHIFFAAGMFQLSTGTGRERMAHEVTHVLQQTGRAAARGRIAATSTTGKGTVQRQPTTDDPTADDKVKWLADGKSAFAALVTRHSKDPGADATLAKLIEIVTDRFGDELLPNTSSIMEEGLRVIATDGFVIEKVPSASDVKWALTKPAIGFLVDCLKVCATEDAFKVAASLIDQDATFELHSALGPRTAFRRFLNDKRGEDWIAGAFTYPPIAKIWPGVFLNTFEQYVLNPGRPRQTLYNYKETSEKELQNINGESEELLANDRVVLAIELLGTYDEERIGLMKALDRALAEKHLEGGRPQERYTAAVLFADYLSARRATARSKAWETMLGRMYNVALASADFWREVGELRGAYTEAIERLGMAIFTALDPGIKRVFQADDALFRPLHDALKSASAPGGLYFLDAGGARADVPLPAEYAKRIGKLADTLGVRGNPKGNVLLTLQMQLLAQAHGTSEGLKKDQAKAIGLAIWWLLDFKPILLAYKPAEDKEATKGYPDRRLRHRQDVALALAQFSQIAGWHDTLADARKIALAEDTGKSHLIVKGHWNVVDTPIDQLQKDADRDIAIVGHAAKLTPHQLAFFYHIDVLRQLRSAVGDAVSVARKTGKLDAEEANNKIEKLRRPWKCVPADPLIVLNPKEAERAEAAGTPLAAVELIEQNPKSVAELQELAKQKNLGTNWSWLARSRDLSLFAWIVPDMEKFADDLRGLEPFATWMKDEGFDALTGYAWLDKLLEIYPRKKTSGDLATDIEEALKKEATTAQEELNKTYRAYTAINRRQVRARVAKLLVRYRDNRSAENMFLPRDAVKAIDMFEATTLPPLDASPQTSLLVQSLADELDQAFDNVRHTKQVPPLFHYTLLQAIKFIDTDLKKALSGSDANIKAALEALLHVNPDKPAENEKLEDFAGKRDKLEAVAKRIEEGMKDIQELLGFTSPDGQTLKSLNWYPVIKPGRKYAFEVAGDDWELVKVNKPFIYHPKLTTAAVTSETSKPILKTEKGKPLEIKHEVLIQFLKNGIEFDVYADDDDSMAKLSDVLFDEGLAREMENLAEGIETGMMVLMDIIELIPGVGQELMIARIAAHTGAFIIGELPAIADAVKKNPVDLIQEIGKEIASKYLTLEGLITFVILGQGGVAAPFGSKRRPEPSKTAKPVRGKLLRVINLLRRLGMRLADAVQWLQLRVAGPMRSLQSSIATRPKLGWTLRKAIDIGLWARDIVPPDIADPTKGKQERTLGALEDLLPAEKELPEGKTPAEKEIHARGVLEQIQAEVIASGEEFKAQFEARLEILREAELPKEIVPLELLATFIIDFFLMRLGAKVRLLKRALENTAPYKDLMAAIASALADATRGTDVDPNEYWRNHILDTIDQQFVDARNKLVDAIYGLTDKVAEELGIAAFRLARPEAKTRTNFGVTRTEFPHDEIELARLAGAVPRIGALGELPTTPGQPLAARVRLAEERRFGHDFRHVRLHTGDGAAEALDSLNANALTTGSHIFLRPGLDPERGPGARVLRHELTHVLQQTGDRPLGGRHDQKPLRGRTGAGLRIDDLREAAADAMARADSAVAREPVVVEEGAEGLQPSVEDVAIDVLKMFTEFHSVAEFEKAAAPGQAPGQDTAKAAWIVLQQRIRKLDPAKDCAAFAQPVAKEIADHVLSVSVDADIPNVVALAQTPIKGARGKKPKTELDFDRFVTLWEAVIFGRTGIAMQFKLTKAPLKLVSLHVGYVHLGLINPGPVGKSPLWDKVMAETPEILGGDADAAVRQEIWQRLSVLGPDPFVWKTSGPKFKFSPDFVEAFGKVRASRKPALKKELPEKEDYLLPSGKGDVGLRIGLHGGVTNFPKQKGLDRESHHTTQYLLVQFFSNDNAVPAWQAGVDYTGGNTAHGIQPRTGKARKRFVAPKGTLDLAQLDPGGPGHRGAAMPAILISADLHRRGQLHVEKESNWQGQKEDPDSDDLQGRSTQGFAIQAQFKRQLHNHVGTYDTSSDWGHKMKGDQGVNAVYDAMIGTYHWMHARMLTALERGLKKREVAYYRGVASQKAEALADARIGALKPKFDLKAADMDNVYAAALKNNNDVMRGSGWLPPG